ncbi:MAG: heavy metal-binding domain-containing protein [Luteimonas sp.]
MTKSTLLVTTTHTVEGRRVSDYKGLVGGDAILGANMFRDFFAGIRDMVGGRSGAYEKVLRKAKQEAIEDMLEQASELGANAVIGVALAYETVQVQDGGSMLMVAASGTAVVLG